MELLSAGGRLHEQYKQDMCRLSGLLLDILFPVVKISNIKLPSGISVAMFCCAYSNMLTDEISTPLQNNDALSSAPHQDTG